MSAEIATQNSIVPRITAIEAITNFEVSLAELVKFHGLPFDDVLVDVDERATLLTNLGAGLKPIAIGERGNSYYLSKMIAAAASGLFDAALNYLWNETIAELRKRVSRYDLKFFFDVAVKHQDKRKEFQDEQDLQLLTDFDLLAACLSIGLISDIGHRKLNHIRDMRNHSSAAHPNHTEITGLELASFLRQCIDYVIVLDLPSGTVEIRALLNTIRTTTFTQEQASITAKFFSELPPQQTEALAKGLFGLNLDSGSIQTTRDNTRLLWPPLWNELEPSAKFAFGTRIATYLANGDHKSATVAREIYDTGSDAGAFLPDNVRLPELDDAIEQLRTAHRGWDNFRNEYSPARRLSNLIGEIGDIPEAISTELVKAIVEVYLGNAYGISDASQQYYISIIKGFGRDEAVTAMKLYNDPIIRGCLESDRPAKRWKLLLELLAPKLINHSAKSLHQAIINFPSSPDRLALDANIRRLAEQVV